MPKASVTRLIERDKKTLINFVLDIEKYTEFIPFCIDTKFWNPQKNMEKENNKILVYKLFNFYITVFKKIIERSPFSFFKIILSSRLGG